MKQSSVTMYIVVAPLDDPGKDITQELTSDSEQPAMLAGAILSEFPVLA